MKNKAVPAARARSLRRRPGPIVVVQSGEFKTMSSAGAAEIHNELEGKTKERSRCNQRDDKRPNSAIPSFIPFTGVLALLTPYRAQSVTKCNRSQIALWNGLHHIHVLFSGRGVKPPWIWPATGSLCLGLTASKCPNSDNPYQIRPARRRAPCLLCIQV